MRSSIPLGILLILVGIVLFVIGGTVAAIIGAILVVVGLASAFGGARLGGRRGV